MRQLLLLLLCFLISIPANMVAQTNEWMTQYVTLDDAVNGTGLRTSSVGVVGPNSFIALVAVPTDAHDIFGAFDNNYLVGYSEADSALGRVAPQEYAPADQFEVWASGLDQITLSAAWQLAGGNNNYVYVANNDANHNILVFELTALGVIATDFRMETGTENIFAIDVDTLGNVYVVDYEGTAEKTDEVKIYAAIGAAGTTWGDFGGHTDSPVATIDLPPGIYQGVAASGDGSQVFVSSITDKRIWKFTGDPVNGFAQDNAFDAAISPSDIITGTEDFETFEIGLPSFLGMDYLDEPATLFAAVDTFLCRGTSPEPCGGYVTGRIFVIDPATGASSDTIDVAQWNFSRNGSYNTTGRSGREGSFTSVVDVDVSSEPAVYSQTYYGWATEKWVFDGDLSTIVSVEQIADLVPAAFDLRQNYPNPFNPSTTIEFDLLSTGRVTLAVYNVIGQRVATLIDERLTSGAYKTNFDASTFPNGVYYYTLETGSFKSTKKMILLK